MSEWHTHQVSWDRDEAKLTMSNGSTIRLSNTQRKQGSRTSIFEDGPIDKAMNTLRDNFYFSDFHEERVRKLFENDNSLTDDLNHLVIAASVMLSDAAQMTSGNLRAHGMGDKIIIEEKTDGEWNVVRTIGVQVAQILAHARAKKRVEELENLVGGLGSDPMDRLDELNTPSDGFGFDGFDGVDDSMDYDIFDNEPNIPTSDDILWDDKPTWYGSESTITIDSPEEMQEEIDNIKNGGTENYSHSIVWQNSV